MAKERNPHTHGKRAANLQAARNARTGKEEYTAHSQDTDDACSSLRTPNTLGQKRPVRTRTHARSDRAEEPRFQPTNTARTPLLCPFRLTRDAMAPHQSIRLAPASCGEPSKIFDSQRLRPSPAPSRCATNMPSCDYSPISCSDPAWVPTSQL